MGSKEKYVGERSHRVDRVPAREREVAVTEPQDAARRGGRRDRKQDEKYERVRNEGVTDLRSRVPTVRTGRECNTTKQGHQGTTSQIARRPNGTRIDGASELSDRANR